LPDSKLSADNTKFPGFDKVSEELPEETSLQRNMKKYLLEGNKIGWSEGSLHVIKRRET